RECPSGNSTVTSTRGAPLTATAVRTVAGGALQAQAASKIIRPVNRRTFLKASLLNATGALAASIRARGGVAFAAGTRETLYNGITLADPWPPRLRSLPGRAITPPYLIDPPSVIPIGLGRRPDEDACESGRDAVQRRRLLRSEGPRLQDVVHGRLQREHVLRDVERRHSLEPPDARRQRHEHRDRGTPRLVHGVDRSARDRPGAAVQARGLA